MSNAGREWVLQWNETARVFEKEERVFEEERVEREMHVLYYEVRREGVKLMNHLVLLQITMM